MQGQQQQQMQAIPMSTQQQQQQFRPLTYPGPMAASPGRPVVSRFFHRHWIFKLGCAGLILAAVLFVVGFASPSWWSSDTGRHSTRTGLWVFCLGERCSSATGQGYPDWMDAVRALEVVALICLVFSLGTVFYQDLCQTPPPPDNKAAEILGVTAGVLGLIGAAVFGGKAEDTVEHGDLDWSFGLAVAGLIMIIGCSAMIGLSRTQHEERTCRSMEGLQAYAVGAPAGAPPAATIPMQPAVYGHVNNAGSSHPAAAYATLTPGATAAPVATGTQGRPGTSSVPSY